MGDYFLTSSIGLLNILDDGDNNNQYGINCMRLGIQMCQILVVAQLTFAI